MAELRKGRIDSMAKKQQRVMTDAENRTLHRLEDIPAGWSYNRIQAFSTDDADMAATYTDMMEKRRELHPGAVTPPTVGELFGLASAYLARSGRMPAFAHTGLTLGKTAGTERTYGAEGSPLYLRLCDTDRKRSALTEGDRLLLVRSEDPAALIRFAESPAVRRGTKWEAPVGEYGILPTVLPRMEGICYDLPALSGIAAASPMDRLFVPLPGSRLFAVGAASVREATDTAAACGCALSVIAHLTAGDETAFAYSGEDVLRTDTLWLRTLPRRETLSVHAPAKNDASEPLCRGVTVEGHSVYLGDSLSVGERVTEGGFTVAASARRLCGNVFRSAMETVLASLVSAAASGADYTGIRLGIGLRLPAGQDAAGQGDLLAAILGIYRVQTEFACPAALFAETDDNLDAPHLTVFAVTDTSGTVPSAFAKNGSGVFCVTPVLLASGIPDFSLLRRLLREVRGLSVAGKLFSARAAVCESPAGCIGRVSDTLTCRLSASASDALPLSLILEGTGLPYMRIGTVETTPMKPAAAVGFTLPEKIGKYVWSDRYEITVLSRPGDSAAASLAVALRGAGADCLALTATEDGPVSRRILTSRILILCSGAVLPAGDKTVFSLRMLTGGGGLILRLDDTAPAVPAFPCVTLSGTLPDGFLPLLSGLCR